MSRLQVCLKKYPSVFAPIILPVAKEKVRCLCSGEVKPIALSQWGKSASVCRFPRMKKGEEVQLKVDSCATFFGRPLVPFMGWHVLE